MPFPDERGPVSVVGDRPRWPEEFERPAMRLRDVLGDPVIAVDHVGSTSVPGPPAKGCLDAQVRMRSIDEERDVAALRTARSSRS